MSDTYYYIGLEHQRDLMRHAEAERAIRRLSEEDAAPNGKVEAGISAWVGRNINDDTTRKLVAVQARS